MHSIFRSKDWNKLEDPDKHISDYKIKTYFTVYCTDSSQNKNLEVATRKVLKKMTRCEQDDSEYSIKSFLK